MFPRTWSLGLGLLVIVAAALPVRAAQDKAEPGKLKFEIYQDKGGEYRWRLKAANGQVVGAAGEGYKAKADCQGAIDLIKKDAASKLTFEVYEDNAKEYRWRLKAANNKVIATSGQGYKAKADAEKGVERIKEGAAKAEVVEEKP